MRHVRTAVPLALALTLVAGPAAAASAPTHPTAPSRLVLTVGAGEDVDTVDQQVDLTCHPAGGSHPAAQQACDALDAVGAEVSALALDPGYCTLQWDPVTVTVLGTWRGRVLVERTTYGNACQLRRATGPVFAFATGS